MPNLDEIVTSLNTIGATLENVVTRLANLEAKSNRVENRLAALETANVAHVAAALPNGSLKGLKPNVKEYIENDMQSFFQKYSNWLLPQTSDNRQRKFMLFCEVSNGQTTRNVQSLLLPSNDDSVSYDDFLGMMKQVFCPPNASLLAQRGYKSYRQAGDEPPLAYAAEKIARWEAAYPPGGEAGRNEGELVIQLIHGLYHQGLKRSMVQILNQLTKENFAHKLGDQLSVHHQLVEERLTDDTSLLGLYVTHQRPPVMETGGGAEPMELNRLGEADTRRCHNCGSPRHFIRECPSNNRQQPRDRPPARPGQPRTVAANSSVVCQRCQTKGHIKANCLIPADRLQAKIQQNAQKRRAGGSRRPGVRQLMPEEADQEDQEEDTEEVLLQMLQAASLQTVSADFRSRVSQ